MARRKSALVALKKLEKSYDQERKALLRRAEDEMSATVHKIVGELTGIARKTSPLSCLTRLPRLSLRQPQARRYLQAS